MRTVVLATAVLVSLTHAAQSADEKPVTIPPVDVAKLGDYRGKLKSETPEYKQFAKKYHGKVVRVDGEFYSVELPDSVHLMVRFKKDKDEWKAILDVRVAQDGVYDRKLVGVRDLMTSRLPVSGSVTGKANYYANDNTFVIADAIFDAQVVPKREASVSRRRTLAHLRILPGIAHSPPPLAAVS